MALLRVTGSFLVVTAVFAGAIQESAFSQAPSIATTQPQALAPGVAADLKLRGGNLAGAAQVWTSFPATAGLTPDLKDNGTNAAEVSYRIDVPASTPVGVHGIRVAAPGGVSGLKLILVDDLPSVAQAAGNTAPGNAQEVTLPIAIDGAVAALSLNYYRFKAEAGQQVSIEVVARRLGSALDPMIRLLDGKGRELEWSDDESGLRGDARLVHTFAVAGDYLVEVRDIRYQGGGGHFYRLRIGDFPIVSVPYPLSVQRGATAKIAFAGSDAANAEPIDVSVPADHPLDWINVGARRPGGKSSGFAVLHVGDASVAVEAEPNNELAAATRVEFGQTVNGRIDQSGDVDHFIFSATKGQKFSFRAITQRQGAPTAVYLRLLNATGGQVAAKEDFGVDDATVEYAFPADGDFILAVEELHRRGGAQFAYQVEAEASSPGFTLTAAANTVNPGAGSVATVTINATRTGYNGPIEVSAVNLPDGVSSVPTVIGPGMKQVELTIASNATAALNLAVPIQIVGTAKIGDADVRVVATTDDAMKGGFNAIPWAPQNLTGHLALGVGPQPQIRLSTSVSDVVFGQQLTGKIKVVAHRADGFNEAITLAVTPEAGKGGLPPNVTAAVAPIPKDQNEVEISFTATDKAALGEFTAALTGTIKQGNTTVTQPAPGIRLKLQEPMTLTLALANEKVAPGTELKATITVERNPALAGEIALTFANLPAGVTAPAAKIAADQNSVDVTLTVAADAAKVSVNNINVKGEAAVGNAKLAANSANAKLAIE